MNKPNEIESVLPLSGRYSCKTDLRLNIWLSVTVLVYIGESLLLARHREWNPLTRGLLALLPLLPALLYARSWKRFIGGLDELQRRMQLEVFLFASLGTIIIAIVVDTLNANDISGPFLPRGLSFGGAFCSMLGFWLAGTLAAIRRYR